MANVKANEGGEGEGKIVYIRLKCCVNRIFMYLFLVECFVNAYFTKCDQEKCESLAFEYGAVYSHFLHCMPINR